MNIQILTIVYTTILLLAAISWNIQTIKEQMEIENYLHKQSIELRTEHWSQKCG